MQTDLQSDNAAAQTAYEGRRWTVELELYIPKDVSEKQVSDALEFGLGSGSLESDHPLIDADFRRVSVLRARSDREHLFTDWGVKSEDGRRSGRGRRVYGDHLA